MLIVRVFMKLFSEMLVALALVTACGVVATIAVALYRKGPR